MKAMKLILSAMMLAAASSAFAVTPKVIAHRGYWTPEGSAQNSIRSLVKADSIGCHASEFDVWMTPDGVMMVNHDPTINGVEIQKTPAERVMIQKLSNGEYIPTLEQYLREAKKLHIRLVLELKTFDSRDMEKRAAKKAVDLVKRFGLQDRTEYIAFSKDAFSELIKVTPKGTKVHYLEGDYLPAQIKHMGGSGIDYYIGVMKKHPEWIKECHDLGLEVNVWTVNDPADMQWCIDHGVDYITTNDPERLQSLLRK